MQIYTKYSSFSYIIHKKKRNLLYDARLNFIFSLQYLSRLNGPVLFSILRIIYVGSLLKIQAHNKTININYGFLLFSQEKRKIVNAKENLNID